MTGGGPTAESEPSVLATSDVFRGYKAEWLDEDLYPLFTEPSFFPELKSHRPCVLTGGRGTGKTTLLKCLSYEGQFALSGRSTQRLRAAEFFGLYYKVNTNRVRAFRGPELTEQNWIRCFAHYVNMEFCEALLRFEQWYAALVSGTRALDASACARIGLALSLELDAGGATAALLREIEKARIRFEAEINNIGERGLPTRLSMQAAPIDLLVAELIAAAFPGKRFYFLIDEFENFDDYQQAVINTLLKHANAGYTFKIGVKELGFRCRSTLNPTEQVNSPSDYELIDIRERFGSRFADFALRVCDLRLKRTRHDGSIASMTEMFASMSLEEEARILGAGEIADEVTRKLQASGLSADDESALRELSVFERAFVEFSARSAGEGVREVWEARKRDPKWWSDRLNNYGYASLFSVRRGKRGFRRLYAGWDVLAQMAGSNLRFFMELVATSLRLHVEEGKTMTQAVSPQTQTRAAQAVGRKNLKELEGLSIHGANLARLLLGLGRVFQVMAWESEGHTPEVTQFELEGGELPEAALESGLSELIGGAVMHSALMRYQGSKLQDASDTRDYDYAVHPIYAALFEYSYRRKRKMSIGGGELLLLVREPAVAIQAILQRQHRSEAPELPEQLGLFMGFYAPSS